MKLIKTELMKELDSKTIFEIGIPSIVLMENASRGSANFIKSEFPLNKYKNVLVFVGKGNNGGDGIATGRILHQYGYKVEFIFLSDIENLNPDPYLNYNIIKNLNLKIYEKADVEKIKKLINSYDKKTTIIIDAIFGIGINKPVKEGIFYDVINLINESEMKVASIDIPSGLSDKFSIDEGIIVKANITATFQVLKTSHIFPDGNEFCGKIRIIDIGIPKELMEDDKYYIEFINKDDVKKLFNKRKVYSHKGNFGHGLNISGSKEKPGAAVLSSYASLKSGIGLITNAVTDDFRQILVQAHPEIMTLIYKKTNFVKDIISKLNDFSAVLVGPGLGNNKDTYSIVKSILNKSKIPVILDADALNSISKNIEILKNKREIPLILTPHPGEFSRLFGKTIKEIFNNRIEYSKEFAVNNNCYLVLKGHHTLIASPEGKVYVNQTGNAGMSTAGSGDVLSGIILGFISQFKEKFDIMEILKAAVFIHGYAGDIAKCKNNEISMTASDIIENIMNAINNINEYKSDFKFS